MTKAEGLLRTVAALAIISDLRNGQAHESFEWDGSAECYVAEGTTIPVARVEEALRVALSFDRGWEAAKAFLRDVLDDAGAARGSESLLDAGVPRWIRAQAAFGDNKLLLDDFDETPTGLIARVDSIEFVTINPCFQALLWARLLLKPTERYEVQSCASNGANMSVSADALDRTMPVWSEARRQFMQRRFDSLPLSTFLPLNFDARSRDENLSTASRSAAWIAIDDVLDALDGSPDRLDGESLSSLRARAELVSLAIEACEPDGKPRLERALRLVRAFKDMLRTIGEKSSHAAVDSQPETDLLRATWRAWGPVDRLPGVVDTTPAVRLAGSPSD